MGILDNLFGSPAKYSRTPHALSHEEIRRLVSRSHVRTLSADEETAVETAISNARHGDGHISLQQMYEALHALERNHQISANDRKGLMHIFEEHFGGV